MTHKLTRIQARSLAVKMGIDFHKGSDELTSGEVDTLLSIRKLTGYRKPSSAKGSTSRYFFYYLQRTDK